MGLSRRTFTKEFKLSAIQRLEMEASGSHIRGARFVLGHWQAKPDERNDFPDGGTLR